MVEAASRVMRALVAVPRWIVSLMRPDRCRWDAAPDRSTTRRRGIVRTGIDLLLAIAANAAALVCLFVLARAIYYPFWAIGASRDELERSWGGPSAIGATVVHWLVAAVTIVVMYGVIRGAERLATPAR
jgi:hypothetical protein